MSTEDVTDWREPVSARSVLRHHPRVRYTELLGVGILCRVDTRAVNALSPAAAAVWGRFDGRTPLAEIGTDQEVVELARRLRAVGALIDAVPAGAPEPEPTTDDALGTGSGTVAVPLAATWRPNQDGSAVVVEAVDPALTDADEPLSVPPADTPTVVIEIGPAAIAVGSAPVERIVLARPDDGAVALGAMQALEQLVAAVDGDALARPGCLDGLAELAERVPVVGRPSTDERDRPPALDDPNR